jgi:hypothetical protein
MHGCEPVHWVDADCQRITNSVGRFGNLKSIQRQKSIEQQNKHIRFVNLNNVNEREVTGALILVLQDTFADSPASPKGQ